MFIQMVNFGLSQSIFFLWLLLRKVRNLRGTISKRASSAPRFCGGILDCSYLLRLESEQAGLTKTAGKQLLRLESEHAGLTKTAGKQLLRLESEHAGLTKPAGKQLLRLESEQAGLTKTAGKQVSATQVKVRAGRLHQNSW
jgi:hypothetical protein